MAKAKGLAVSYARRLEHIRFAAGGSTRLRVYFEEWDEPMISGIG